MPEVRSGQQQPSSKILDFVSPCTNLREFSVTDHVCPQAIFIFPIRNMSAAAANGPNQEVRGDVEYLHSYTTLMTCDSCSRGAGGQRLTDSSRGASCFRRGVMVCVCAIFQNTCRMLALGNNNEPGYYVVSNYKFSGDQFLLLA